MPANVSEPTRAIITNQTGPHEKLEQVVSRHLASESQKPFSAHTQQAFEQTLTWLDGWQGKLILDSCCGVGESTANIATAHPDCKVIGVDKSAMRTNKHSTYSTDADNYIVVRADLNDFFRLLVLEKITLYKHYILYPNPYPKQAQLQKRWYASSAFKSIVQLGGQLEVRSNWKLYIEEFALALKLAGQNCQVTEYNQPPAITPFERKYWQSGQSSWQLITAVTND